MTFPVIHRFGQIIENTFCIWVLFRSSKPGLLFHCSQKVKHLPMPFLYTAKPTLSKIRYPYRFLVAFNHVAKSTTLDTFRVQETLDIYSPRGPYYFNVCIGKQWNIIKLVNRYSLRNIGPNVCHNPIKHPKSTWCIYIFIECNFLDQRYNIAIRF